jgi:hypothetical protein
VAAPKGLFAGFLPAGQHYPSFANVNIFTKENKIFMHFRSYFNISDVILSRFCKLWLTDLLCCDNTGIYFGLLFGKKIGHFVGLVSFFLSFCQIAVNCTNFWAE